MDDRHAPLLARRMRTDVVAGRAYVIHARNGGVGVAVTDRGRIGYCLHRVKFGQHYLFTEIDWDDDSTYGTAIPLTLVAEIPPTDDVELLAWLAVQEEVHRAQTRHGAASLGQNAHAWVEKDGDIYDWQTIAVRKVDPLSVAAFNKLWKPRGVRSYTADQARAQVLRTKHYGPWKS